MVDVQHCYMHMSLCLVRISVIAFVFSLTEVASVDVFGPVGYEPPIGSCQA
jgi:hypothetical protein